MIIFRADASPLTGLLHLRRSAYLASLLRKNNPVLLRSREDKKTAKFLAGQNFPTALGHDGDAMDLAAVTAIVFDLLQFSAVDSALLQRAKKAGVKTVQIVHAGGECQPADILVLSLPEDEKQSAPGQNILSGPAYALLHHKFRHFNLVKRSYRKNIKRIFINLGDQLAYRDLRRVVDNLHRLHLRLKIAPGLNLKKADKRNLMKIYPGIRFCGKSESPARAYFEADLALVPAGEEALEAAAVGTPALFMPREKVPEIQAAACVSLGTGVDFPSLADLSLPAIRAALAPLTLERRTQMGAAGKKLVDGLGAQRFLKILKDNGIIA
jgi:spore coat polysaccharide biosynthesis predicted glycosyltransferase SpsG